MFYIDSKMAYDKGDDIKLKSMLVQITPYLMTDSPHMYKDDGTFIHYILVWLTECGFQDRETAAAYLRLFRHMYQEVNGSDWTMFSELSNEATYFLKSV